MCQNCVLLLVNTMELSKQTVVAFRLSKQAMEPLRSKRMATGYQYCAMLLLITMEISKQSVVGPSLTIMEYYCGRKLPLGTRHATLATCSFRAMRRNMISVSARVLKLQK